LTAQIICRINIVILAIVLTPVCLMSSCACFACSTVDWTASRRLWWKHHGGRCDNTSSSQDSSAGMRTVVCTDQWCQKKQMNLVMHFH